MSGSSVNIQNITSVIGLAEFLAEQFIKHRAESQGITTDQAIEQAKDNFAAAQQENDDLKKEGHDQ